MEKYLKEKKLNNLSNKKKQQVVTEMIQSEVVGPAQQVWNAYSQASQDKKCAAKLLCQELIQRKVGVGADLGRRGVLASEV